MQEWYQRLFGVAVRSRKAAFRYHAVWSECGLRPLGLPCSSDWEDSRSCTAQRSSFRYTTHSIFVNALNETLRSLMDWFMFYWVGEMWGQMSGEVSCAWPIQSLCKNKDCSTGASKGSPSLQVTYPHLQQTKVETVACTLSSHLGLLSIMSLFATMILFLRLRGAMQAWECSIPIGSGGLLGWMFIPMHSSSLRSRHQF